MTIDDYADWAAKIARPAAADAVNPGHLAYLGPGLAAEAGEVGGVIKKRLRDGVRTPDRLADELGDVAYDWANLCVAAGRRPSEILDRSVRKTEGKLACEGSAIA